MNDNPRLPYGYEDNVTCTEDKNGRIVIHWPEGCRGTVISRELLDQMVEDKNNRPRWIPVEERLPEDETPVLVYCIPRDDDGTPSCAGCDGHGGIISTAWYERLGDGDGEHWVSDGLAPPLFWMPLPEPPEVK